MTAQRLRLQFSAQQQSACVIESHHGAMVMAVMAGFPAHAKSPAIHPPTGLRQTKCTLPAILFLFFNFPIPGPKRTLECDQVRENWIESSAV